MIPVVLAALAAVAARASYPKFLERRQAQRRPLGPNGIVVGAEPIELHREGAPGVLLLHGGGDTPQVLSGLAHHLHASGFSVRVPLLAGHGRGLDAFARASAEGWYNDAATSLAEMRRRHEWVGVVGLSMGGALAIRLAAEQPAIPAMVLLAPYVAMPEGIRRLAEKATYWGWLFPYFPSRGGRSIRDPDAAARALGYGLFTPAALQAMLLTVRAAAASAPRVKTPTLVVQSREDNRIPPETAERGFAQLGATEKQFVWTNGAGHVITVDFGHERVFELTRQWLRRHYRGPLTQDHGEGLAGRPANPPRTSL
jgi:carboxylesterase